MNNRDTAQIRRIQNVFMHEKYMPDLYEQVKIKEQNLKKTQINHDPNVENTPY